MLFASLAGTADQRFEI